MNSLSLAALTTTGALVALAMAMVWRWLHPLSAQAARRSAAYAAAALREPVIGPDMARALFEASEDGVVVCDVQAKVLAANSVAGQLLNQAQPELLGRLLTQWLPAASEETSSTGFPISAGRVILRGHSDKPDLNLRLSVSSWGEGGASYWLVVLKDLSEQVRTRKALQTLARFDGLTGLPNRVLFRDNLARAMERARRSGKTMALFFLDLDRFKVVNDSLGHEAGDKLLKHVADVLTGSLRGGDSLMVGQRTEMSSLSRLGGDEFTVILEDVTGAEAAAGIAQRLLDALAQPLRMGVEDVQISASIGISLFPCGDVDIDNLIRNTDLAMYRSKALGRSTFSFYSDDLNAAVSARLSLEGSLRRAVERGEFFLQYQPKANLATGQVTGVEALLRWRCPGRGVVTPDRFISVLEDTGLIVQAGAWVIREACAQAARWDAQGVPPMNMAVNLSARQLRDPQLVTLVRETLAETGIAPKRLELELTESLLLEDTQGNRATLTGFSEMGVRLAIDDFGTGHSSLAYLRRMDVDTLKIDRSFIMQLPEDPEDAAITRAVVALGKSLNMNVVAEGVETEAQAQFLQRLGCNEMQGWLLCRAMTPEALVAWLRARQLELEQRPLGDWAPSRAAENLVEEILAPAWSPAPAPAEAAEQPASHSSRAG